jgi:hypothetical protein
MIKKKREREIKKNIYVRKKEKNMSMCINEIK